MPEKPSNQKGKSPTLLMTETVYCTGITLWRRRQLHLRHNGLIRSSKAAQLQRDHSSFLASRQEDFLG